MGDYRWWCCTVYCASPREYCCPPPMSNCAARCGGMNAARRFSYGCDAVKGILGNLLAKVYESLLHSRLGKVGGSGRIKFTSGYLVCTWSNHVNLRIGLVLGQRLMTFHEFMSTGVRTSWGIEKWPQSVRARVCACVRA